MESSSSLGSKNEMKNNNEKCLENDDDDIMESKPLSDIENIMIRGKENYDEYIKWFMWMIDDKPST